MTEEEMKDLFATIDKLVRDDEMKKAEMKERLMGKVDECRVKREEQIVQDTVESYTRIREEYDMLTLVKSYIKTHRDKFKEIRNKKKEEAISEMMQYNVHDSVFSRQLQHAKP